MSTDYVDGFLRYDVLQQNSFAARDLQVPRFGRAQEVRGGNTQPVRSIAWSSDGRRVATGTEKGGLRVWTTRAGQGANAVGVDTSIALPSSKAAGPHNGNVATLAWSPTDPDILISGCKNSVGGGVIAIWDVTSPASPITSFKIGGERSDVLHLAFHPSGRQFAAVCPRQLRDEVFFYWLVEKDGKEVWEKRMDVVMGGAGIDIGIEEVNSLHFWTAGDAVLAVSNDGSLTSWYYPVTERAPMVLAEAVTTATDEDEQPTKKSRIATPMTRVGSQDPEEVAAKDADRETPEDEVPPAAAPEGEEGVEDPEVEGEAVDKPQEAGQNVEDGEDKAGEAEGDTSGDTEAEKNADAAGDTEAEKHANPAGEDQGEAATAGQADGDVEMAEPKEDSLPANPTAATPATAPATAAASPVHTAAPSPLPTTAVDEKAAENVAKEALARAAAAAELERRKHRQLQRCFRQVPHFASLLALAVDPLGRFFAVGGQDARLSLLDTRDWIVQRNFDAPTAAIRQLAFSPDGEFVAVGGDDNCIFILSVYARTTVAKVPIQGSVNALTWHPKKNTLAYSTNSKVGVVWYLVHQE